MCAPCKVVINEESGHAISIMSTIRELISSGAESGEDSDVMFRMAEREIGVIQAKKQAAVEYAESISAPQRWVELLRKL